MPVKQPAAQPETINQWETQGVSAKGQQQETSLNAPEGNTTYYRLKVVQGRGSGPSQVQDLDTRPQLEWMLQHLRVNLLVPAMGGELSVSVDVLLDSGSGVMEGLETLLEEVLAEMPGVQLARPFEGKAWVVTATGEERNVEIQTCPMYLTVDSGLQWLSLCSPGLVTW